LKIEINLSQLMLLHFHLFLIVILVVQVMWYTVEWFWMMGYTTRYVKG